MVYSYKNGVFLKNNIESPTLIRISNEDGRVLLEKIFVSTTEKPIFLSKAGTYLIEIEGDTTINQEVVLN